MKVIRILPVVLAGYVAGSCSKSGAERTQAKNEALPETEVAAIVTAVSASDVAKVSAMLQANPKLIKATFSSGGPYGGWPLLMIAAKEGSKPMVELLLGSGADVNAKNFSSEVALHYAALHGHKDIVQLLLDKKAEVNVRNDAGATPLAAATSAGKPDIAALLKQHGAKE